MIRLVEIALFLAPIAAFAVWRLLFPRAELSPKALIAGAAALVLVFLLLAWLRMEDAEPAGTIYAPAELHNGQVTPPRVLP
jgi:hypothetical protein